MLLSKPKRVDFPTPVVKSNPETHARIFDYLEPPKLASNQQTVSEEKKAAGSFSSEEKKVPMTWAKKPKIASNDSTSVGETSSQTNSPVNTSAENSNNSGDPCQKELKIDQKGDKCENAENDETSS